MLGGLLALLGICVGSAAFAAKDNHDMKIIHVKLMKKEMYITWIVFVMTILMERK